ncbi:hypothetical protein NP118_23735, partial [Salmonella enterica]|nr:hypothetical protein [Salmonella enterica]
SSRNKDLGKMGNKGEPSGNLMGQATMERTYQEQDKTSRELEERMGQQQERQTMEQRIVHETHLAPRKYQIMHQDFHINPLHNWQQEFFKWKPLETQEHKVKYQQERQERQIFVQRTIQEWDTVQKWNFWPFIT